MKKKIICIFIITLLISSAMTTIIFSNESKVEASDGEEQTVNVNLDFDWTWERVKDFANVIHYADYSSENDIPKGRAWATAGENYTIVNILKANMYGPNNPCGLTEFRNLSIGPLDDFPNNLKQYSTGIVINDYNLTIKNNSVLYRYLPYSELFPIGVGCAPLANVSNETDYLNQNFSFTNVKINVKSLLNGELLPDWGLKISCSSI